ncbi:carboxymuconolactone decarboxylase family protein [Ketobacter sp.]|nr:MAG: hypothetical protein D6160_21075 [Ketobacter sp.]
MRFPPIGHEQWTDDVRDILASFSVPFSEFGLNGDESEKDQLSPILSTVLQNPALARVYFPFAKYLLRESSLQPRHTRMIILRVAWCWQFDLEWTQHSMMAVRDNLLTENEVGRIAATEISDHWGAEERLLLSAVDHMRRQSDIPDAVWQQLAVHFDQRQLADLTFTIGGYVLAGMYMNAFRIPVNR